MTDRVVGGPGRKQTVWAAGPPGFHRSESSEASETAVREIRRTARIVAELRYPPGVGARTARTTAIRVVGLLALAATVVEFLRERSVFSALGIACTAVLLALLVAGPLAREPDETAQITDIAAPRPATDDTIARFAQDLKERLLAGPYRSVTAFADNYALTGVSRSTTYAAISGTRLPSDSTVDKLLSTVVGADRSEIQTWLTRRCALDTTADAEVPGSPASAAPHRVLRLREVVVIAVGLAVLAAGAGVGITLSVTHPPASASPPPAPASATTTPHICSPAPDLRAHQVAAHVANTQGEGTYTRIAPQTPCHTGFLADGDTVTVVCQDLSGPVINDVYDGFVRGWPVWDKLGSGAYVSDLYVDLPKGPQPALVDQLPSC